MYTIENSVVHAIEKKNILSMCRFSSKVARLLMTSCSFFFSHFLDVRSESDVFFLTNEPFSMTSVGINWEKESPSQESSQRAGREQKPWAILIQEWPLLASGYRRGQHWSKTKIHLTSTLKYFFFLRATFSKGGGYLWLTKLWIPKAMLFIQNYDFKTSLPFSTCYGKSRGWSRGRRQRG